MMVLKKVPLSYLFRGVTVYYVTGMRRSGNHALISWLVNAIEGKSVELTRIKESGVLSFSDTGRTVFLNEVNACPGKKYVRLLWRERALIRRCRWAVVSTEDCYPDYRDWRVPRRDQAIYIKRSVLNLVASRIQSLKKSAESGKSAARRNVDAEFFRKLTAWMQPPEEFAVWSYDQWVTCEGYRAELLKTLDSRVDILPVISRAGGGSSFSGRERVPSPDEALFRYKEVEFSAPVLDLLAANQDLLNEDERRYLVQRYTGFLDAVVGSAIENTCT